MNLIQPTEAEIKELCHRITQQIVHRDKLKFNAILALTRNGLVPAAYLSHLLDIEDIRTVSITREEDEFKTIQAPNPYLFIGKDVLVVGGVLETGQVWSYVRKEILGPATRIATFKFAVLYYKDPAPEPDYYGERIEAGRDWITFPWEA